MMLATAHTLTIRDRLSSHDPEVRRIAVMALPDGDEDEIERLLLDALKDPELK